MTNVRPMGEKEAHMFNVYLDLRKALEAAAECGLLDMGDASDMEVYVMSRYNLYKNEFDKEWLQDKTRQ